MKRLFLAIVAIGFYTLAISAFADTLELKNGSVIKGTFIGGSEAQISFRVGSSLQHYPVADVVAVRFDSDSASSGNYGNSSNYGQQAQSNYGQQPQSNYPPQQQDYSQTPPPPNTPSPNYNSAPPPPANDSYAPQSAPPPQSPQSNDSYAPLQDNYAATDQGNGITVPGGTRITIRTVDAIDSSKNHVGDQFTATLDQALYVNNVLVAPRGAYVYGRMEEIKESGQLSGRAQLRLSLTGISLRGQTYPIITGDYQLSGKSRSTGTAAKVGGGAVVGALIGAAVGGGKGAAIGAGVGAGAGTAAQIATKGDQIHIPSETILDFTLDQAATLPVAQNN